MEKTSLGGLVGGTSGDALRATSFGLLRWLLGEAGGEKLLPEAAEEAEKKWP
jgi:hypothetical protein